MHPRLNAKIYSAEQLGELEVLGRWKYGLGVAESTIAVWRASGRDRERVVCIRKEVYRDLISTFIRV